MFDEHKKEFHIYGCETCPFLSFDNNLSFCFLEACKSKIKPNIYMSGELGLNVPNYFPEQCELRNTNFKLTRHFEKE